MARPHTTRGAFEQNGSARWKARWGEAGRKARPTPRLSYRCSVLRRLAMVSVEVAPAQTRTLSMVPGK